MDISVQLRIRIEVETVLKTEVVADTSVELSVAEEAVDAGEELLEVLSAKILANNP